MESIQDQNGKQIKRITATWVNDSPYRPERRAVEVQGAENGIAFVQPITFDPWKDAAIYYHGWETPIGNLRDVNVVYEDGSSVYLGDPPVNNKPTYIGVQVRTSVP